MRKLIEITQENLIVCDNPFCGYTIKNPTKDPNADVEKYLNEPCPKCRCILLTDEDQRRYKKHMAVINFINRWFSWLTIFIKDKPKEKYLLNTRTSEIKADPSHTEVECDCCSKIFLTPDSSINICDKCQDNYVEIDKVEPEPTNCPMEFDEDICEGCQHNKYNMVGHPGGGLSQVEEHFCDWGHWIDDF